jgi:uncharacterized protein with HEPN domain
LPPTLGDRLAHVLTAIENIRDALSGRSVEQFSDDLFRRMAVERLFEVMSEASRHIPAEMKEKEKDIAWQKLADLGNLLRHAYHRSTPTFCGISRKTISNHSSVSSNESFEMATSGRMQGWTNCSR